MEVFDDERVVVSFGASTPTAAPVSSALDACLVDEPHFSDVIFDAGLAGDREPVVLHADDDVGTPVEATCTPPAVVAGADSDAEAAFVLPAAPPVIGSAVAASASGSFATPGRDENPLAGHLDQEVLLHPADGRRRAEAEASRAAAVRLYVALETRHPDWLPSADASRVSSDTLRRSIIEQAFYARGARYCLDALFATCEGDLSYEAFCSSHEQFISGGAYPPTAEIVAWYVIWRLDRTRALKARTGAEFKGESGHSALKHLAQAYILFPACGFSPEVLKADIVQLAAKKPPDAVATGCEVAHAGAFVQFWLGLGLAVRAKRFAVERLQQRGLQVVVLICHQLHRVCKRAHVPCNELHRSQRA